MAELGGLRSDNQRSTGQDEGRPLLIGPALEYLLADAARRRPASPGPERCRSPPAIRAAKTLDELAAPARRARPGRCWPPRRRKSPRSHRAERASPPTVLRSRSERRCGGSLRWRGAAMSTSYRPRRAEPECTQPEHAASAADVEDSLPAGDTPGQLLEQQSGRGVLAGSETPARVELDHVRQAPAVVLRPGEAQGEPVSYGDAAGCGESMPRGGRRRRVEARPAVPRREGGRRHEPPLTRRRRARPAAGGFGSAPLPPLRSSRGHRDGPWRRKARLRSSPVPGSPCHAAQRPRLVPLQCHRQGVPRRGTPAVWLFRRADSAREAMSRIPTVQASS